MHGPMINDVRIALLTQIGLPFVVHGRSTDVNLPYSWIDVNNRGAFERGTQFLFDLGHRRIALLNGLEHMDFAFRRRKGYEAGLQNNSLQADPHLTALRSSVRYAGREAADMLLSLISMPKGAPKTRLLEAELIIGRSTGPAPT